MPIRPIDIRRKEFRNGFRGYDANQVDDFLDTVADEFERNYNENQRMREETNSLRERLQQFEDLEGSIRAALVHAEQAADDLRRSANRPIETVAAPTPEGPSDDEALQGTGPLADEPPQGEQETQVLGQGETMTFGPETDESQSEDAPADEPVAEGPVSEESVATEPETEPSTASGSTSGEPVDGAPGAADEGEREEGATPA